MLNPHYRAFHQCQLVGSDELESVDYAALCRDRVVGPILQLKDELFQTFRQRRSIVSVQEYETDKASLERMLKDFENDFAKSGQVRHQDSRRPCHRDARPMSQISLSKGWP